MLISVSLTYADVNTTKPYIYRGPRKRRFGPRRKHLTRTQLQQLRKRLKNIRAKIISRLDSIHLRRGDPLKNAKKRSEAMRLKMEYNNLVRRIQTIVNIQKAGKG